MTWDVLNYCRSCLTCQKVNKQGNRQTVMQRLPVITEPFESCAIDLVGPLPKANGGARFLLTFVCMASRWPESIQLTTVTANVVAEGLVQIFSRTGLPLTLLSGQAKQFTGSLAQELAHFLNIQLSKTTAYHPQSRVVERLHGTLETILMKAAKTGHDRVKFLPLAMFALHQCPNRDASFYGHVHTPLDLMLAGWAEKIADEVDICDWVDGLKDRLSVLQDMVIATGLTGMDKRMELYDRTKTEMALAEGDRCMIPGLASKLEDSLEWLWRS